MVALATAFVRLRLDTSQSREDIEKGLGGAGGEKAAAKKGRSISAAFAKGFEGGGSTFGRVATTMAARAAIAGSAVAAATPAVTQFVAALAPAAGAGAALPAVLGSIATVSATAKVAVLGVGDAISAGFGPNAKAAEKNLDQLHGKARTFAVDVIALKKPLDDIQRRTSNRLFAPLLNEIKPLAQTYLPVLRQQMPQTAGLLGQLAEKVAQYGRSGPAVAAVNSLFNAGQGILLRLQKVVGPLITGLSNGIRATTPFVGQLTNYFVTLALRVASFVNQAAKTGQLAKWISDGIVTIRQLVTILNNLRAITTTVFQEFTGGSNTLLARLVQLTAQARAWTQSTQGAQVLANLFQTLGVFGSALRQSLAGVLPQIATSLQMAGPAAASFATALSQIIVSLGPLLPALTGVGVQLLTALIPAMNSFATWLSRNQGLLQAIAPVLLGYVVAVKAVSVATTAATIATRAWSVVMGVAKAAQIAWTAINWLAVAPVHAHTLAMKLSQSTIGTWLGVKRIEASAWLSSTAATVRDTAAKVANRIAAGVAWVNAFIAVKLAEVSAWAATTAAAVANRVATLASAAATNIATIATNAWAIASKAAAIATRLLGVAIRFATGPVGLIITGIGLLIAAIVYLWKNNETFRRIVLAVWKAVQVAISAVGNWFRTTFVDWIKVAVNFIIGYYKFLWAILKGIWNGIMWTITNAWKGIKVAFEAIKNFVTVTLPLAFQIMRQMITARIQAVRDFIGRWWTGIKILFGLLKDYITKTLPAAFRSGVDGIRNAWSKVQDAAKKPVTFVVNSVINPLIDGYNKIAGIFGAPKAATIKGFAEGGRIPGPPSARDNLWGSVVNRAGRAVAPLRVATGEFIVNAKDTARALPLLRWVNSGMRGGPDTATQFIGRRPADMPGDGSEGFAFAKGGLVGFLSDVWGAVSNPTKLIKAPIEAAINRIPGSGAFRSLIVGLGRKLLGGLLNFAGTGGVGGTVGGTVNAVKARVFAQAQAGKPYVWASAGPGGYDCSGIVSAVYNILHGKSPYSHTFSTGSLPGPWFDTSRKIGTLTAGWSHPGQSPAGSVGHMAGMIAGLPFESTGSSGVRVGARARKVTQFAHIGVARAHGGLVDTVPYRLMDSGGTLAPGYNLAYNGLGRPERLSRADGVPEHVHFHFHGPVASERAAEDMVYGAWKRLKKDKKIT